MSTLSTLKNTTRTTTNVQRVGRGPGSGRGKTSCRGHKGDKSRSGYKRRYGQEGGQLPLYRKMPRKGFSRGRFAKESLSINFSLINMLFNDGDVVSVETLRLRGVGPRLLPGGLKILAVGKLEKKVTIEAHSYSANAKKMLEEQKIEHKIVSIKNNSRAKSE